MSKATQLSNTRTRTQAECLPLEPHAYSSTPSFSAIRVLSITLSEAGFLRTLGNVEPKFHYIQLPQNHTVIHNLSGRNPQGFFGTISFLLILTPVPSQPPQHRFCSSCHSALPAPALLQCELPQLQQGWHQARGNKPIRAH